MDKKVYYIGSGALILGGLIYFAYRQGKKQTTQAQLPPNDNQTNPQTNTPSGASTAELTRIAGSLWDDMSGWNLTGHKPEAYAEALTLSDYDFVRLYNIWNSIYQSRNGETLTQMFDGETYIFFGETGGSVYYAFKNRLNKLNLK